MLIQSLSVRDAFAFVHNLLVAGLSPVGDLVKKIL